MPRIVKLGNYIEIVPQNKSSNSITKDDVVGISITKEFIKTKANLNNVNVSDYNRVGNLEFCYATNTARMGDRIAIALNKGKPCYVSKIYPVFRIKDTSILDPDYLMLFLKEMSLIDMQDIIRGVLCERFSDGMSCVMLRYLLFRSKSKESMLRFIQIY